MKTIKIKLNNLSVKQTELIGDFFKEGKVIAYPTDTVYGLGCIAIDSRAINRVKKIKKQSQHKPLLVLVSDYEMLRKYCRVNKKQVKYLNLVWPGPITVVLKLKKRTLKNLTGGFDSLAVRLPKNDFLIKIIKKVGAPIVSTSLNIVGKPIITDVNNLEDYFKKEKPDLAIDAGEIIGKPSKLVDIRDIKNIKVLR